MDALLDEMYKDALMLEDMQIMLHEAALCNGRNITACWKRASARLKDFIGRLALFDMEQAKLLLNCWEKSGSQQEDFRQLCANVERDLLPILKNTLHIRYQAMEIRVEDWLFQSSDCLFFTAFNIQSNRYIHSACDPIKEARILADELYQAGTEEFHLLGVGLGYLPYELWENSRHTMRIYIYEEDETLLKMAYQLGALEWIDPEFIHIVKQTSVEEMLGEFWEKAKNKKGGHYVSDYKVGSYGDTSYDSMINLIDYNMRMERMYSDLWKINRMMNRKRILHDIRDLPIDYDLHKREFAVVSAGPSLNDNIKFLKENAENLTIIAINASLKRLFAEGIRPDIVAMLDMLPTLRSHLDGIEEETYGIPLVMPLNGSSTYTYNYKGPIYIVPEGESEMSDDYRWSYGGTVASLALDVAFFLKASKVYLIGSDLAYSEGKNYADGLVHSVDEGQVGTDALIYVLSTNGGKVGSNILYNRYRAIMEKQISLHSDVKVINLSKNGAAIKGTIKENWFENPGTE